MQVKELIEKLKLCDPEAEVFYGSDCRRKIEDEPDFELYDFDVESHKRVRSRRSCSSMWSYQDNVVVFVYD
jgi:hypothetical protein